MKILCIGDIVGKPGREALKEFLPKLVKKNKIDFVICNAENAAGGAGLTPKLADEIISYGCDVLTLGDHVWDQKELEDYLDQTDTVIRPANIPDGAPGVGCCIKETKSGQKVGVINLMGRVFMRYHVDCPFQKLKQIVERMKSETSLIVVDMHAEATSEKNAIANFIDGQVSLVFGTHTHIQTSDERILPQGTAFITDLGMTGPYDSVIGQDKEIIVKRFVTSIPARFHVADGDVRLCGIIAELDAKTSRAKAIERVHIKLESAKI